MFISEIKTEDKMPSENTILILKKDLKTENGVFAKGTRVVIRKRDHTVYYDRYDIHSAETTDFLYIHRKQDIEELNETVFETDEKRTVQYQTYLNRKHINVCAILITALFVFILAVLLTIFTASKSKVDMEDIFILLFSCSAYGMAFIVCLRIVICEDNKEVKIQNETKLNEILKEPVYETEVLSYVGQ